MLNSDENKIDGMDVDILSANDMLTWNVVVTGPEKTPYAVCHPLSAPRSS